MLCPPDRGGFEGAGGGLSCVLLNDTSRLSRERRELVVPKGEREDEQVIV
jgi:hypothetical protein